MEQIMQVVKWSDIILLGICVVSFTQIAKQYLKDDVEAGWIMLISVVLGIAFGILGNRIGIIDTVQNGIIEGVLTGGICSGGISLVFEMIEKVKSK